MAGSIDYMVIDSSMFSSWKAIIWEYIRLGFDFAFPFFAIAGGIVLFILVITFIFRKFKAND